ncbi:MAG TPA: PorP/SprF family type IX secretion system membrane protein [Chitinophagales bacterium]|nr:PorP/SprF family type IX secretion system membrane protein [Chitinophagales bacterium]
MKKATLLLIIILWSVFSFAQDIHYSQFYASPLTLNPALTGVNECNYRANAMYRNQWHSVTDNPYQTPSISFDINNVLQRVIKKGTFSLGGLLLDDKAGDGNLQNLSIMASMAYQRPLNASRKLNASLGLQVGYVQKSLDWKNLTWETQFDGQSFNQNINSGESLKDKVSYIDLNAGLYLSFSPSKNFDLFLGGAAFHIIPPKEKFLNNGPDNKLGMRIVAHGGFRIGVTENVDIIPQVLFMTQTKAREVNVGASVAYKLNTDVKLFAGGYYRLQDAVVAMIGIDYKHIRLGLSYDINTSSLSSASGGKGGFEVSLTYTGCLGGFILDKPIFFCPRY